MARGQIDGYHLKLPAPNPTESAAAAGGSWNLALLMRHEPGRRNRRTIDAVLLAGAAFVVVLGAVIAESASAEDEQVEQALVTLLGWAGIEHPQGPMRREGRRGRPS